jgi:hypothetical protein
MPYVDGVSSWYINENYGYKTRGANNLKINKTGNRNRDLPTRNTVPPTTAPQTPIGAEWRISDYNRTHPTFS